MQVYNPSDEREVFTFNATDIILEPNKVQEIPDQAIGVCLTTLGDLGVMIAAGEPKQDKVIIAEAESRHQAYLRKKLGPVVSRAKQNKAAGFVLTAEEDAAIAKLKEWEVLDA